MTINNRIHNYLGKGRSWYQRVPSKVKIITVHHDAIPHKNQSADTVLNQIYGIHHNQKGWAGISYHYYIHTDGQIYQLNNHEDITWHDKINYDSIGIVVHGYFHDSFNNDPTEEQLKSLEWLLNELSTQHPEFPADHDDIRGHRERSSTACPGDRLFPYVVEYRDQQGVNDPNNNEGDDMSDELNKVLEKYSVNSLDELDAKIFESCGTTWGNKESKDPGGHLKGERIKNDDLDEKLNKAIDNNVELVIANTELRKQLEDCGEDVGVPEGWEINGITVEKTTGNTKILTNYKRSI